MGSSPPDRRFGQIFPAPGRPLYKQIVDALKIEVVSGRVDPDKPLPSARALAADLLVSVITVKRAYDELERAHILYRRQGLGTFLDSDAAERLRLALGRSARDGIQAAMLAGRKAGISDEDLLALFREELSDEPGDLAA